MVKLVDKVEKNRSKTLIVSIIVFTMICITASYIKDKNSVNVYSVENITDDTALIFKELKLVELGDDLYIENGCTINIKEGMNYKDVKNIDIEWYIDNKKIYNKSFEKVDGGTVKFVDIPTILRKIKINSNSILKMKITYLIDGKKTEFTKDIKLRDWKSKCEIYNNNLFKSILILR